MKKITLQWRITILTALVLIACTVTLTLLSMHNVEPIYDLVPGQENWEIMGGSKLEAADEPQIAPITLAKQEFNGKSILLCTVFTVIGTVAVYFLAGHALKPLRRLSEQIDTIDENNLSAKLPEAVSKDEIGRLTNGFNRMLSRLEDAFLRQKRFTANAAHELKTPLAMLKTGIQVLEDDPDATLEDFHTQNKETLDSADRLSGIIDDLLTLASAGEAGTSMQETIMLEPLFEAICSELAPRLEQRNMVCHIECGDLSVMGNPAYLYRAFLNLIDNACKYAGPNGNVWINAEQSEKSVLITLRDDGAGISPEHLPYIFDAFYRVDKSRSREMGGSGLGLSIVKAMIEACNGTVSVQSDGRNGTCFSIKMRY